MGFSLSAAARSTAHRARSRARVIVGVVGLAAISAPASAANFEAVTTSWRIQDYKDGNITLWFTPASCANGQLFLLAAEQAAVKDRFWSMLLGARLSGRPIGIFYSVNSGICVIDSFYLKEQ